MRPLSDSALERLAEACRLAGPLARVVVPAGELRDLIDEVRRHREIAAALIDDAPDSRYDAEIVAIRKQVADAVLRNRVPVESMIATALEEEVAAYAQRKLDVVGRELHRTRLAHGDERRTALAVAVGELEGAMLVVARRVFKFADELREKRHGR